MSDKIRSITPLRYVGGKSKVVKKILSPLFPDFTGDFYDPFLGGGSIPLWIAQLYPHKKIIVNDLNKAVADFWIVLQKDVDLLVAELLTIRGKYNPFNPEEGVLLLQTQQNELYNNPDIFYRAIAFYVLNKISFSGMTEHGSLSKSAYEKTFNPTNIGKLFEINENMKNFHITSVDYEEVINKSTENDFVFLDPPYDLGDKSTLYGKDGEMHKGFDHKRFARVVYNLKSKWMITYNDSEEIRERFKDYNIKTQEYLYCMAFKTDDNGNKSARKKDELIITNY